MRGSHGSRIMAALALALVAGAAPGGIGVGMSGRPTMSAQSLVPNVIPRKPGPPHDPHRLGFPKPSGWTDRRYRRAAAKRRNQLANRRANRG